MICRLLMVKFLELGAQQEKRSANDIFDGKASGKARTKYGLYNAVCIRT